MRKYRLLNILSLAAVLFGLGVCTALAVDTDGDRMPDDWELANGFDPNDPADADLDADSDGLINFNEYRLNTDPNSYTLNGHRKEVGGLLGEYFEGTTLQSFVTRRVDSTVNFDWGGSAPDPELPADGFSVRWTGWLVVDTADTYYFYTSSDDGVRLYVDGNLVINNWTDHGAVENQSLPITLQPGDHEIVLEYYESVGDSIITLSWSSTGISKQIIPSNQLKYSWPLTAPMNTVISGTEGFDVAGACIHSDGAGNYVGTYSVVSYPSGSDPCRYIVAFGLSLHEDIWVLTASTAGTPANGPPVSISWFAVDDGSGFPPAYYFGANGNAQIDQECFDQCEAAAPDCLKIERSGTVIATVERSYRAGGCSWSGVYQYYGESDRTFSIHLSPCSGIKRWELTIVGDTGTETWHADVEEGSCLPPSTGWIAQDGSTDSITVSSGGPYCGSRSCPDEWIAQVSYAAPSPYGGCSFSATVSASPASADVFMWSGGTPTLKGWITEPLPSPSGDCDSWYPTAIFVARSEENRYSYSDYETVYDDYLVIPLIPASQYTGEFSIPTPWFIDYSFVGTIEPVGCCPAGSVTTEERWSFSFTPVSEICPAPDESVSGDFDGDGLTDAQEFELGLDPTLEDSDGDDMADGYEYGLGFDPLDSSDGSQDPDRDGYLNSYEVAWDTDPLDPLDYPSPTITVDVNSADPIRDAIAAAVNDYEIILIPDGLYSDAAGHSPVIGGENIDLGGKKIMLISASGAENCIIDLQGQGRGFVFQSGEGPLSVLSGITIINGQADMGGGMFCDSTGPSIIGCRILDCFASISGGGIAAVNGARPIVRQSYVLGCLATDSGGGLYAAASDLVLESAVIQNNSAADGGGVFVQQNAGAPASTLLDGCTIADNFGSGVSLSDSVDVSIRNTILWGNAPLQISVSGASAGLSVTRSCIDQGYTGPGAGAGIISADPEFCMDGYHLESVSSPCVNVADPADFTLADIENEARPEGGAPDIGADEFVDSDSDGLPDWWEVLYGLDPLDATGNNGATGNPDGDTDDNATEYMAGTNPLQPSITGDNLEVFTPLE